MSRTSKKSGLSNQDGGVAVITAIMLTVLLWCTAIAVDVGSLYLERRTAQGAVDLAAIAAARNIEDASRAAKLTLEDNGIANIRQLVVTPGNYRADTAVDPSQRFVPGSEPYNAVHVALEHDSPLYFAGAFLGKKTFSVGTEAIAATTAQGAFSIGSRLVRLEGGLINAVLGGLLGGNISLTAMDYEALADANVKLFAFMDALATEVGVEGGTYSDVLNANANAGHVLDALASVTQSSGNASASGILRTLSSQSYATSASVPLNGLVDLGPYANTSLNSTSPGFDPSVNVMQMVSATGAIANGENQVTLNLGASIPGLADIRVDLAIGEPPRHSSWFTVGAAGAVVRTAQTRLRIVTEIAPERILPNVSVRIPLYAEIAYAEAKLQNVTCGADPQRDSTAEIAARPGIAELWFGDISASDLKDFSAPPRVRRARVVALPLLTVSASAHAQATNMRPDTLVFDWLDAEEGTVKRTHTRDTLTTLLSSLVGDLDINVRVGGFGIGLPGQVAAVVRNGVKTIVPALDTLVSGLLEALGITLGEADVRLHGIRCDGSVLVG